MAEKLPVALSVAARWVIPVDGTGQVLENHSVVVDSGRIVAILPSEEANAVFSAAENVVLKNHILMPGLINAHTHAAMSLFRGMADDLALMDWLNQHIWPAEGRWVSDQFVADGTRVAIAEMIKSGTTCFNDMYFFPTATARVATEAKIRVSLSFPILDFPTAWANSAGAYINRGLQLHDAHKNNDLITTQFGPHAPYTVSDEPLQKVQMYSVEIDRPIHMHVHETAFEVADAQEKTGKRPLQRLHDLGL
ncbi:MAG TPA: amidohydrolase family protein, partial [Pseudomonadales bacterium]|nr:amidohydrolase family protein [Pseudomonadales bacterium]